MNRTLLPSLSLSFLVCENGPTVPSQREVLRTMRGFAGVRCSGQFGGFRVRVGHFPLPPTRLPQHLGDTSCPIAPAPGLGDLGAAVSRSSLGPRVAAPEGTRHEESALPAAASQDEPASSADPPLEEEIFRRQDAHKTTLFTDTQTRDNLHPPFRGWALNRHCSAAARSRLLTWCQNRAALRRGRACHAHLTRPLRRLKNKTL